MRIRMKRLLGAILICSGVGWLAFPSNEVRSAEPAVSSSSFAFLRWESKVGRIVGQESDSEGPQSFALKKDGGVLVLDQVNSRILELDPHGNATSSIALPAPTFDDIEVMQDKGVLALDRLGSKVLVVLDFDGHMVQQVQLVGRGITHAGLVTALLPRSDGVWLEVQHRHSVKVLDHNLVSCERQVVMGRPALNGRSLRAVLDGNGAVTVSTGARAERTPIRSISLQGKLPVQRVVWLDMDASGKTHIVLHEARHASTSPYSVLEEQYAWIVLDESFVEIRRTYGPWILTQYDQRVECRLAPDGRMWQMALADDGVRIIDWERGMP